MKKIAVVIPSFTIEYSFDFLRGVSDFFKDKEIQCIIAQTKTPHSSVCIFDYQYWSSMELVCSDEIDAVIVVTGVYCADSSLIMDDFIKAVTKLSSKPIISIAINLPIENSYSVLIDCKNAFQQVVKHLSEVHNCKRIGFFSANSTKSREAFERYDAFVEALAACNLEFNQDLVWDGGFTDFNAIKALKEKIHSRSDVNFDAIVCANDMMASGCLTFFSELGIRIPGELKIIGFDDSLVASLAKPRISTINQQVYTQGMDAAQRAWYVINNTPIEKIHYTKLFQKYRQSCGCIPMTNQFAQYKNSAGIICEDNERSTSSLMYLMNDMNCKNDIITVMDMLKGTNTLRQFYYNLKYIVGQINMKSMSINLYEDPIYMDVEDDFVLPNKAELYMYADLVHNKDSFRPGIFFDPHQKLFVEDELANTPGIYILQPIFSGEANYGYMLCGLNNGAFADYNVFLKIIITSFSQTIEYTAKIKETEKLLTERDRLIDSNETLDKEAKTDDLTGILNRRGFFELGQHALDVMQEMSSAGMVFFFDIDGLKKINDKYGHSMGDLVLKLQAEALKRVFRSTDIIGRLSGDEFGVVALGMIEERVEKVHEKLLQVNKEISEENNLPFVLSVSMGTADLAASTVLRKLLTVADKELYMEKRQKNGQE